MTWFTGSIVYLMIWWTVIFMILPLWVKRDEGVPEITAHGAPENPYLKKKLVLTTLVSALVWLVIYVLIEIEVVNFRELAKAGYS